MSYVLMEDTLRSAETPATQFVPDLNKIHQFLREKWIKTWKAEQVK